MEACYHPGGLRSLAAVEAAPGLVSSADTLFNQRNLWHTTRLRRSVALQAKIDLPRESRDRGPPGQGRAGEMLGQVALTAASIK
jgi:hypothetical protein